MATNFVLTKLSNNVQRIIADYVGVLKESEGEK